MSAIFGTKSANERTFVLPKPDISDFFSQAISDRIKSLYFTKISTFTDKINLPILTKCPVKRYREKLQSV